MLQFLLISSCFAHSSLSTFQRLFPSRTLTIIVFPSSTAERADRERGMRGVREISNTAVPWPPGLSGHTVGVIYSKVYSFHGDKMKTNQALTKWESNILKPSQSAWGVFLLSDRLFGKTDKHWTYCLTVCLSVCLYVCLSVSLSYMPESYIETPPSLANCSTDLHSAARPSTSHNHSLDSSRCCSKASSLLISFGQTVSM